MRRVYAFAVVAVVVANATPLLLVERVPTQDGPSHVAAAAVLASPDDFPLYEVDRVPRSNAAVQLVTSGLLRAGMAGPDADRLLAVLLVIALPLALAYAAGAAWVAPAAAPVGASWFLWMGFTNFLWGVVAVLLSLGWWRRGRGSPGLAALLLVAGACHAVALGGAVGLLAVQRRRLGAVAAAALPAVVLTALTLRPGSGGARWTAPATTLWHAATLSYPVRVFDAWETAMGGALVIALVAAIVVRRRDGGSQALLAGAAGLVACAVALPSTIGQASFVPDRLVLLAAMAVLVWLGSRPPVAAVAAVFAIVGVAAPLARLPAVTDADDEVAELVALAAVVPGGAALVPVVLADRWEDGRSPRPLAHAAGWLTAGDGRVVDLTHYEATLPYFPARFRPEVDPVGRLVAGPLQAVPPDVRIASYERTSGVGVDAVVTWGPEDRIPAGLRRDLDAAFRRVAEARDGRGALWLRRDQRAAAAARSSNGMRGTSAQSRSRS